MTELIMREGGEPFKTIDAAKAKRTRMGEDGQDTNIVEIDEGYAIEIKEDKRPKRIPIGRRDRLVVDPRDKDPNYVYRMVNDEEGRIRMFEDAGYEIVRKKINMGENRIEDASQMGSAATKPVGRNQTGVLMRIKKEWYEEDQKAKTAKIRESMKEIQKEPEKPGQYGKIEVTRKKSGRRR